MKKIIIVAIVALLSSCSHFKYSKEIGDLFFTENHDSNMNNIFIGTIFLKDKTLVFVDNKMPASVNDALLIKIKSEINDINDKGYVSLPHGGKYVDKNGSVVAWSGGRAVKISDNEEFYSGLKRMLSNYNVEIQQKTNAVGNK